MAQASPQQLLNTSWTLHRLSPLHHGREYQTIIDNPVALSTFANRLRDQLTGDALAGFQAGMGGVDDDASFSKTGALRECKWKTISSWSELYDDQQHPSNSSEISGILVVLAFENITYKAAMLAGAESDSRRKRKDSTTLPLLLTKLPNALRQTFISFLSSNFDTYCSALRLPSSFMSTGLEVYLHEFSSRQATLEDVIKEMQITLSFSQPVAPQLRSLNISIPRASCMSFVDSNRKSKGSPFLVGLSTYLENHLAMKLDLGDSASSDHRLVKKHVRLSKIACGGFVLGGEGRVKLVASADWTGDNEEGNEGALSEKDRLMLRASQALLGAVIQRAVAGET